MPKPHQIIERHWQHPNLFLSFLLKPLSMLFAKIAAKRRDDFVSGRLKSEKLPVPVVVVGNIHAGGTGKTPIVAALVSGLQEKGVKVGIISRGYGRKSKAVHVLNAESRVEDAGDEPLLLFRKTGAPTAVGSSRAEAGRALLAAHPDIGLIVADDGLQHYALRRDVEIAVFPAVDTGRTDLDLLPNGSLREPLSRLDSVDAVVVSGGKADASFAPSKSMFHSRIETGQIYRLNQPSEILDTGRLKNQTVAAVAGIAKPERFFDSLRNMGITLNQTVALPDHADIAAADLPNADAVIITEKDAVKFSDDLNMNHVWVLPVCAIIEPDLAEFVLERLEHEPKVV
ncbi:tetraacyldisaccharide 4'-kinase [Neisseria elongata subsp. glycolytica ATCC 29315]|uniref:Tetraacyldisaccharide 4'-kinase n=1 Tax=Neisseria elongata subsp. glycolytica ATCC 29315 TaxID=546263 RepID=D4DUJ7_NEIEG|nr:tetraacyldisaccharide 4'-kinase [Neisseria elongata]AJE18859.1 tetraacyldisaccharide 4'-kinase [Neisseria elongata subsp. glycolytica ATCC 29315]EFE48435.1 tetraacyldisaccharide 4'-kinase [Neisseria elongata subsp. glycolytica ATCC 29315]SQH50752.1 tetraacyldisaccharide 4'-kinase (lipid A 4'-kinase) [Neisseria elongata subsp. glycolytica]